MFELSSRDAGTVVANCGRSLFDVNLNLNCSGFLRSENTRPSGFVYRVCCILDVLTIDSQRIDVHRAAEHFQNVFADDDGVVAIGPRRFRRV